MNALSMERGFGALLAASIAVAAPLGKVRADDPASPLVLTGTEAAYSLTAALASGTPIRVENVPPDGRQLTLLKDYIARRMDSLAPTFAEATAVVTVTNASPGDPLYRFAREATSASSTSRRPCRGRSTRPASRWRTRDLQRRVGQRYRYPRDGCRAVLLAQRVEHDSHGRPHRGGSRGIVPGLRCNDRHESRGVEATAARLARRLPEPAHRERRRRRVRADGRLRLSDQRHGPVRRRLFHQAGRPLDGRGSHGVDEHLRDNGIKVVLHKWLPSDAIQNAVRAAGAELVVLDAGDPGIVVDRALAADGLQQILRKNLEAIAAAAGG